MKRTYAYNLALLVAFAWAIPTCALAKSETVALPERNPDRPESDPADAKSTETAAPSQEQTPDATTAQKPSLRGPIDAPANAAGERERERVISN